MTFGAIVACSNSAALIEVGGDVPFYFDPTNEDSIAKGISKAIEATDRESRLAAGYQRSKQFSWDRSAQIVLNTIVAAAKRGKK
jgi:glycosyltransferase involved in cell wall biosynthesis